MTIVLLNDFAYVDGGASRIALGSARELAKGGHRVILFAAVGPVDPGYTQVENLEVVCLHQREIIADPRRLRAAVRGLWNRTAAVQLRATLSGLDPQGTIIHLHTWTKGLSSSVVQLADSLGFRIVLTLHDYFTVCPTGSFFLHPTAQICKLKPMSIACIQTNCDSRNYGYKLWRVGRQWVQSHAGRLPSGIRDVVTLSDLSEQILVPLLPDSINIHRVPNFIEGDQESLADVETAATFTFVGRLSPEKGPLLLAECVERLSLDVDFVGDGPLRTELTLLAPSAHFTGWLAPKQVRSRMRASRALVFPSLWYETQGLVVAEALSLGVPVIVPSTSAAREWVEDGVTGLVFKGGDVDDLARQLCRLRDSPALASALGREGYKRYWKNPATLARHSEELLTMYKRILSRSILLPAT